MYSYEFTGLTYLRGLALVVIAIAWLLGIVLESSILLPPLALLAGAVGALISLLLPQHDRQGRFIMLLVLILLLGAYRYTLASPLNDPQAINHFIAAQAPIIRGIVADEPKLEGRSRMLVVSTTSISTNNGASWHTVDGQIEVSLLGTQVEDPYGANYGDQVQLTGKLSSPPSQSSKAIQAIMAFPRVRVEASTGFPVLTLLYHLRLLLANAIVRSLPQPEAALLVAIVLSMRTPALQPLLPSFNATGVAHLIAPSGFKVTVLAGIAAQAFRRLPTKHRQGKRRLLAAESRRDWQAWISTACTIGVIALYTILSGVVPAAVRAGIMGCLLVLAPRVGRIYNVYTGLAVSALAMSIVDPYVLWDAGFLLSFLGTLGIVLLTPYLQQLLSPLSRLPLGRHPAEAIAVTLAAQIATFPIFVLTFGQLSLVAPLTNMLVVPLLETFLTLGTALCSIGTVLPILAPPLVWIAYPLLRYTILIVTWCYHLPLAYLTMSMSSSWACIYYGLLALIVFFGLQAWPLDHNDYAPPLLSKSVWQWLHLAVALTFIATTGLAMLTPVSKGQLTIDFLNLVSSRRPDMTQGTATLIHTPEGKTVLIDGGLDPEALSQALDSRLPSWQRSLDYIILTATRSDHLAGLQDVLNRYTVREVIDGGMLHPNTSYTLWRRTIRERVMTYVRAVQGMHIVLDTQTTMEVLWPHVLLYKGQDEPRANALVLRLNAPSVHILFLGEAAQSAYTLRGLLAETSSNYLHAEIVQIIGEDTKVYPIELASVLHKVDPTRVVVASDPSFAVHEQGGSRSGGKTIRATAPLMGVNWQAIRLSDAGSAALHATSAGWNLAARPTSSD